MLKAPNALYPSWANSSSSTLNLDADSSYLYTFSRKPPFQLPGFWSLTAYEAEGYFIDSSLGVYALGDRNELTFPDGGKVTMVGIGIKKFRFWCKRRMSYRWGIGQGIDSLSRRGLGR
jgi:hypothetical protein